METAPPTSRVLPFRKRNRAGAAQPPPLPPAPADDLGKYERPQNEPDDFRHRMLMNVLGFGILILLVGAGVWLAVKIADMSKDQDCVLSGRRNCGNVVVQPAINP